MPTPQQQYDQTKLRLDNNLKKAQLLNQEIEQKEKDNQEAIKIVQEIQMLRNEAQSLVQPIIEDQGAIKILSQTDGVETSQIVQSN
tara:strand:+ start:1236 stop:1493 length:258 start_codon:yes stop_codon:yes gene_type:complete